MGVFYALIFVLILISFLIFRFTKFKIWKRILMVIGVWLTTFVSLAYYMTINFDKGFHRHRELVEIAEEDRFSKEFPIGLANFDKLKSVEKVKTVGKHKIVFQGYPYHSYSLEFDSIYTRNKASLYEKFGFKNLKNGIKFENKTKDSLFSFPTSTDIFPKDVFTKQDVQQVVCSVYVNENKEKIIFIDSIK